MWDSWDSLVCSKRDVLAVVDVRDLSLSLFSPLPREIHVGVCWQPVSSSISRKLLDVPFILAFPVENTRFVYSTEDGANHIIFTGSSIEFDFSTLGPVPVRTHVSTL